MVRPPIGHSAALAYFFYLYFGVVLLISLVVPSKRRATLARWRKASVHVLIREIAFGVLGLLMLGVLVYVALTTMAHRHSH